MNPLGGEGTGNLGSGETDPIINHNASVNVTWSISPNLVNESRIGLNRIFNAIKGVDPATVSQIGMTRYNSSIFPGIPLFTTNDLAPAFGGMTTNDDQGTYSNTVDYADTLAWSLGKHTIRFGFEARQYQINLFNNFASRGFLLYNTFADILTGSILEEFTGTGQTYRDFRAHDLSAFVQDDWKVTPRLTLNLGLRYDYLSPSTDKRDRLGNFDPSRLDANTLANAGPGLANGFILPAGANFGAIKGTPGVSNSTFTIANNLNFAPRVGFAWDPAGDGKTAVRGGYGIYYVRISNQTLLQLLTAAPFFQLSAVVNPGTTNENPFPNLPVPSQFPIFPSFPTYTGLNSSGRPTFTGGGLIALNPFQRNMRTPYAEQFNFSIQRELPGKFTLELGYAGSQGVRLLQSLQLNQALLANPAAPIRGLTANSAINANARVTVPGFSTTGLNTVTANGHSVYHAFTSTLSRRLTLRSSRLRIPTRSRSTITLDHRRQIWGIQAGISCSRRFREACRILTVHTGSPRRTLTPSQDHHEASSRLLLAAGMPPELSSSNRHYRSTFSAVADRPTSTESRAHFIRSCLETSLTFSTAITGVHSRGRALPPSNLGSSPPYLLFRQAAF